ncbi:MAG: hypothetical protein HY536_01550, partial [Candidatus Colwellbacteria bacterium]|nr:hypothetical protein [Candidatus Colwellbacteria bacterium]
MTKPSEPLYPIIRLAERRTELGNLTIIGAGIFLLSLVFVVLGIAPWWALPVALVWPVITLCLEYRLSARNHLWMPDQRAARIVAIAQYLSDEDVRSTLGINVSEENLRRWGKEIELLIKGESEEVRRY